MKHYLFLFFALLALTFAACNNNEPSGDGDNTPPEPTNLTWDFDEATGTLYIYGEGEMGITSWNKEYREQIKKVVLPDGLTSICKYAFVACVSLTSINIPNTVTTIGASAFASCNSLPSITIPGSVESIGERAFSSCDNLATVKLNDGIKTIGANAFSYCPALKSMILPNSVSSVGKEALRACTALESI